MIEMPAPKKPGKKTPAHRKLLPTKTSFLESGNLNAVNSAIFRESVGRSGGSFVGTKKGPNGETIYVYRKKTKSK